MSDVEGGAEELHGDPDPATGGDAGQSAAGRDAMRQAYLDLFEAEYRPLVQFMMRAGASSDEARDAAQEAFERGWLRVMHRRWQQIANPRAWIRGVALNYQRTQLGQGRRSVRADQTPERAESGLGHAETTDQALDSVAVLNLVDDEHARMVIALDMDDIPGPDIATILGLTQQQVRDLRKKARRALKRHLTPQSHRSARITPPTSVDRREGP